MAKEIQIVCKSVFKNNDKKNFKSEFTKKWIELINENEKNKTFVTTRR